MAAVVANESGSCVAVRAARVCDVCATRGAMWYCAADEAHLCTACDTQVHSANAVSRRHERVRLTPNGTVQSRAISHHLVPSEDGSKRKRSSRPYSHHLRKLTRLSNQLMEDKNRRQSFEAELELFDFLDADDVVDVGNQEVPSMSLKSSSPSCSASDLSSEFAADREGDHSADSLAPFFKGKAALCSHTIALNADIDYHFQLVPDAALDHFVDVPADAHVDLAPADDAFFFPGDILGLESFVPETDLVDDFALSFNLALQNNMKSLEQNNYSNDRNNSSCASDTIVAPQVAKTTTSPHSDFLAGPFAKFFAQKSSSQVTSENSHVMDSERIKQEARAMLQSCAAGEDEAVAAQKPLSLQLNLKEVLAEWSDRDEPWILVASADDDAGAGAGLVPDMDGDRDARVLRYKEKRRNRLFSKTIRYEVRKLNAERRPRMKGRFVKRTPSAIATC